MTERRAKVRFLERGASCCADAGTSRRAFSCETGQVDSQRGPRSSVHRLGEALVDTGETCCQGDPLMPGSQTLRSSVGTQFAHHLTQLGATQRTLRHRRICDGERSGPAGHPRSDCRGCVARRCCSGRLASGNGSRVCFRSTGAVAAASSTGGRAVPQTSLTRRPRYGRCGSPIRQQLADARMLLRASMSCSGRAMPLHELGAGVALLQWRGKRQYGRTFPVSQLLGIAAWRRVGLGARRGSTRRAGVVIK